MEIDHDPIEPPRDRSRSPWLRAWVMIGLLWAGSLAYLSLDWHSIALGALTAGIFVAHMTEVTGNRVPLSWRGKAPRR